MTRLESDVELTVHDNGQGIAADILPLVFDMVRQGDSGFSRRSRDRRARTRVAALDLGRTGRDAQQIAVPRASVTRMPR